MTELKTLKDLGELKGDCGSVGKYGLKEEAIKWIKCDGFRFEDGWECFKMFHNITEEDLK